MLGAVQDQHRIAALVHGLDHGTAQALPVSGGDVGTVDQRRHFAKAPGWQWRVGQLLAHARFEAGRGRQAIRAGLHANGAAGVEHHHVVSWLHEQIS